LIFFAREDPAAAEVVKLRYFVGLTVPEIAEAMKFDSPKDESKILVSFRRRFHGGEDDY
jgi:hypothetical protein